MNTYVFKDAEIVRKQIEALKAIYPELTEDAELLADTLEGETNLEAILSKLVSFVLDAESMAEAIKARKDALDERMKRYKRQGEAGRDMIHQLMDSAEQNKVTLPEATLSISKGRKSINVINVDQLPQGFYQTERKAKAKEIMTALEAGEKVPGAEIKTGEPSLTMRVK